MDNGQFVTYLSVVAPFLCIALISGGFLVWLLHSSHSSANTITNIFGLCVLIMTIGILIFDFFSFVNLFVNPLTPQVAWLLMIIRATFGIIAYYASSIMSYNIYHVIIYKTQVSFNWSLNPGFIALSTITFIIPISIFLISCVLEFYEYVPVFVNNGITNELSVDFKILYALFNLTMYFRSECYIHTLYGSTTSSPYTEAVKTIVRRMRLYPLCQLLCEVFYFIWGIICGYKQVASGESHMSSQCFNFYIFSMVLVYLNAPLLLLIYLVYNPSIISSLCSSKQPLSSNITSALAIESNSDKEGPFSAYRIDFNENDSNRVLSVDSNHSNRVFSTDQNISNRVNNLFNVRYLTDDEVLTLIAESKNDKGDRTENNNM